MASTIASSLSRRFVPRLSKPWIMTEGQLAFSWNGYKKKYDVYLEFFIVEEFLASRGQRSEFSEISLNILSILRRCFADT
jgi:hypothetical protein